MRLLASLKAVEMVLCPAVPPNTKLRIQNNPRSQANSNLLDSLKMSQEFQQMNSPFMTWQQ
jgi:hypothetical protein